MLKARDFEGLVYHEKRIHKSWLDKVVNRNGSAPPRDASDLVSELLVTYIEAPEPPLKDVRNTARELATLLLPHASIEEINLIYRDYLLDSIIEFVGESGSSDQWRGLVYLSNTISNAFCDVHTDMLRRSIRQERMKVFSSELKLAKTIQSHLLPKVIPQIPGFEFAGRLIPAEEVGGDYWSIKHYPENGVITMKVADISGHGVAAATLVAAVKFISGGYYRSARSAAEVMEQTNRVLTKETPHDILITMVYAWLRPETYEITLVNAGHEPVFVCSAESCVVIAPTGPVLGVTETAKYDETTLQLDKGDIVFFGSDGITEAGIGRMFGMERLKRLVVENTHLSADELADKVVETVLSYAPEPHDDISLLVTKVTGDPPRH